MAKIFNSFKKLGLAFASDSGKQECFNEESRKRKMATAAKAAKMGRRNNKKTVKPAKAVMQVVEADITGNIVSESVPAELTYETLAIIEAVSVKVAKKSGWMQYYNAGQSASGIGHWMNGKPLKGAFLNLCLYHIEEKDFGRKITANVHVVKKTLPDGRSFIMLDVFKMENTQPKADLRILDLSSEEKGYEVIGTDKKVVFAPRS